MQVCSTNSFMACCRATLITSLQVVRDTFTKRLLYDTINNHTHMKSLGEYLCRQRAKQVHREGIDLDDLLHGKWRGEEKK